MTAPAPHAAHLIFTCADPAHPDLATVGAVAHTVVAGLQRNGEPIAVASTGAKSPGDVFMWLLAAAAVATPIITLLDLSLKLAQLLHAIKQLRTPPAPPITVTVRVEHRTAVLDGATAPTDAALLAQLLATHLPERITPANLTIEVRVPPTPPNDSSGGPRGSSPGPRM